MFNKHNINLIKIPLLLCIIGLFTVCKKSERKKPDISGIEVNIEIQRFEQDLFGIDTANFEQGVKELRTKYPQFIECFVEEMLRMGTVSDTTPEYIESLRLFATNEGVRSSYDSTMAQYGKVGDIQKDLEEAFRYSKYYFPELPIPKIITYTSDYSYGAVSCGDSVMAIGLDLFLGANYSLYPGLGIPAFIQHRFQKEYIVPSVMKAYAYNFFGDIPLQKTLLAQMIHNGKILYYLDLVLTDAPDKLKVGFTENQLKWLKNNEGEVWAYFLGENILYSTSRQAYNRFVTDGPGTPGMPMEAPGNTGSWVGWQIVRAFMKQNPDVSIQELMKDQNAQRILEKSGYKPRR